MDSAVAAALAVDAGHDVTGVHLALSPDRQILRSGARGCCSVEDAHDARRVADELGIPFYVWDLADRFREDVVDDFVAEYAAGRTPNPCLRCNEKIKFSAVLDRALALGFDAVVTGHHARLADGELRRSVDAGKDQSYVLGVLTAEQLAGAMFPLGSMTKERVRRIAAGAGSPSRTKPDTHDICFIPDGDTLGFLCPGWAVTGPGGGRGHRAAAGEHGATYRPTVGQRRGLGVASATSAPVTCWDRAGHPGRSRSAPPTSPGSGAPAPLDRSGRAAAARGARRTRPGLRGARRRRRSRAEVQLRAHGDAGRLRGCPRVPTAACATRARPTSSGGVGPRRSRAVLVRAGTAVRGLTGVRRPGRRPGRAAPDERRSLGWRPPASARCPATDPAEAVRLVARRAARPRRTCPSCPAAAPGADLIGRSAALLVDLAVDLTPGRAGGWCRGRASTSAGRAEFLARDLDALHDVADGLDRAAQGAGRRAVDARRRPRAHPRRPRRRRRRRPPRPRPVAGGGAAPRTSPPSPPGCPGAPVVVQLDEPSVPAVLQGGLPTVSGFGKLRRGGGDASSSRSSPPSSAGCPVPVVVHCCAAADAAGPVPRPPARPRCPSTSALVQDLDAVGDGDRGRHRTCSRASSPAPTPTLPAPKATASRVQAWWRELGFPADDLAAAVTLTPSCGLAGATPGLRPRRRWPTSARRRSTCSPE